MKYAGSNRKRTIEKLKNKQKTTKKINSRTLHKLRSYKEPRTQTDRIQHKEAANTHLKFLTSLHPFPVESSTTCHNRRCVESVKQSYCRCEEQQVRSDEDDILRHVLQLTACPCGFIDSVINVSKRSVHMKKEVQPLRLRSVPYIKGVCEKLKRTANRYNM
jgi:hypothetical protein